MAEAEASRSRGGEQQGDLALQPGQAVGEGCDLVASQGGHLGVVAGGHGVELGGLGLRIGQCGDGVGHGL